MAVSIPKLWRSTAVALAFAGGAAAYGQTLVFSPGVVTAVAGNGSASYSPPSYAGVGLSAALNFPRRIAVDASGNLYWMEKGGQIARVLASGKGTIPALPGVATPTAGWVYTVAGNGGTTACAGATDKYGDGCPASQMYMTVPYGIAVDARGNVYLGDAGNNLIRVVYAGGTIPGLPASPVVGNVYVVAGTGTAGVTGDGGPATSAQISASHGLSVDAKGNVYFADSGNNSVRVVYASGTLPGINNPVAGNLYTIAGGATVGVCAKATSACGDGGPAITAQINGPDSTGVDGSGNIYVSDTGDLRLRAIYLAGSLPGITNPIVGDIYTVAGNGVSGSGPDGVLATASSLTSGMAQPFIDAAGDVYVPDATSNTVRKIAPNGVITTVMGGAAVVCAGSADTVGDGCASNQMTLSSPTGITLDALGNAYIADYKNNLIRMLGSGASSLSFSGAIGTAVLNQTVSMENQGTQPLALSAVTVSGPFAQVATGSSDCTSATVLPVGTSCQLVVSATASQVMSGKGAIVVASNALNASSATNTVQMASTITVGSTTTTLVATPTLANVGQPVTLMATVTVPAGTTLLPTGSVTFLNGGTPLGSTSLAGGKASFTISNLAAATYNVTSSYAGDVNFAASVSKAVNFTVSATPVPVATLVASASSVPVGQAVTLTATLAAYTGNSVPTGIVTFQEGSVVLGKSMLNAAGIATLNVSSLPAGSNILVANYGGDGVFTATSSPTVSVTGTQGAILTVFPGKLATVTGSHTLGAGFSGDGAAATAAQVKTPLGLSIDAVGNLYLADSANNRIRRVDAITGSISTVAGSGTACATASLPCGDGGLATAAKLNGPAAVRVDAAGNLYILDKGDHAVRKVTASSGVMTTVAGTLGTAGATGDGGLATAAKLNGPRGMWLDNGDNLYIADSGNALVRRVDAITGLIATVAGSGATLGDGGPATAAQLISPRGVALDAGGNLYIADIGSYRVREVNVATGIISTVVGTGTACTNAPCGDGGIATSAGLGGPQDVVLTSAGDLLLTDPNLNVVRRVSPAGMITTIAGQQSSTAGYESDGGAATSGLLSYPNSLALDAAGNLYVSEANNSLVREISSGTTSLAYGSLNLGSTASQAVVLASTGNQPVGLSGISVAQGYLQQPSGFSDCAASLTLNAGASCTLNVEFAPLTAGVLNGSANVVNNATNAKNGLTVVSLSGTGVASTGTAAQTLTFGALPNAIYGTAPIALIATATSGLAVTYGSVSGPAFLVGSTLKITGVGTVSVTAYQFGNNTYAAAAVVTQTFNVTPAVLTVTADSYSRALGAANPAFTYKITGFVAGDTPSVVSGTPAITTSASVSSIAGQYPIVVTAGTLAAANYTENFVNGVLAVTGQSQTITYGPMTNVTYGVAPITLSASSSAGLAIAYTVIGPASISGSQLSITGVGNVAVTASQAGNTTFAAATPVIQSFSVAPATLVVTAVNASRAINTPNPTFTYSFGPLVNGDTAAVVTGTPVFSTTATQQSPLGAYPILVSQGTLYAANYVFAFAGATLTIVPPPPDFTLSENLNALTLYRGVSGKMTLTLTPIGNYNGGVAMSCGPLPVGVSCVFNPTTLVLDGGGSPVAGTLSITTNGNANLTLPGFGTSNRIRTAGLCVLPAMLFAFLIARRRRNWMSQLLTLGLLLAGLGAVSGCGAGTASQPPVISTVTITATGNGAGATPIHSVTLNLTVI